MADKRNDEDKVAVRAVARYIRISPYKARKVMDLVRGKEVEEAKRILAFTPGHASTVIEKVLDSAVANAENNNSLRADELVVGSGWVDEGPTLKRWRPRAMGRATRIRKRTSHITIVLSPGEKKEAARKRKRPGRSKASKKG